MYVYSSLRGTQENRYYTQDTTTKINSNKQRRYKRLLLNTQQHTTIRKMSTNEKVPSTGLFQTSPQETIQDIDNNSEQLNNTMGRVAIIGAGIFVTAFTVNLAWDVVLAREKYLSDNGVSRYTNYNSKYVFMDLLLDCMRLAKRKSKVEKTAATAVRRRSSGITGLCAKIEKTLAKNQKDSKSKRIVRKNPDYLVPSVFHFLYEPWRVNKFQKKLVMVPQTAANMKKELEKMNQELIKLRKKHEQMHDRVHYLKYYYYPFSQFTTNKVLLIAYFLWIIWFILSNLEYKNVFCSCEPLSFSNITYN